MDADERWIARHEALTRLGVKAQTLYAYVSRGRIAARPDPADPRRSLYAAADVARLCGDGAEGETEVRAPVVGAAARGEADIQSSVGLIAEGRLFYRGLDAVQLAETATVEAAARLLWDVRDGDPFVGLKPRIDPIVGGSTQRRVLAVLGRRAIEDRSLRSHDPAGLKQEAASLLNEVVDSVSGPGPRLYLHQRLARGFKAFERDSHLIRRALVLGADCGLDEAVLATRAAAFGGAPLAGAVLAGITTLSGAPLGELGEVVAYVGEARRDPSGAARRWLALKGGVPGFEETAAFGRVDPRARALLEAAGLPADLQALLVEGEAAAGRPAGFDLALALTARRLDLGPTGAGDLLLLGRLVGLLAHAVDQATDGSPIRARLRYVGPEPGAH
ncbi:citrate/2-methylcitrate synthase [Brevundimonas sp. Bb-A]|uniref:citrate/2-methylcitrate synthase n=1 Tax=Brevundimonas sp. Bb-A TaxID=2560058 RepID=UPI0012AA8473|nr:citrate/2-methylcitrate synthase [Brevundimonas sp. Bb-A]QFU30382.1 citrate synthase [Brevundimonas sp. Bb-A]